MFLTLAGGVMLTAPAVWSADSSPGFPPMLDHILLGCSSLDQGITFVEQHTGVRPAIGGVHPGRGTRNALLSLGQMHYLEVIAPDPAQAGQKISRASMVAELKGLMAPRIIEWAVHTSDIGTVAEHLRKAGVAVDGPTPGSRKRPDGRVLNWQTLNLENDNDGMLPFFIQWGAGSVHPSIDAPAGCQLKSFGASSPDPHALSATYRQLGLVVDVERGPKSALHAEIAGPRGKATLNS
jgi:hypothetical protein